MDLDIYTATKHWTFTHLDEIAEEKFSRLEEHTRKSAPEDFYHSTPRPTQNRPSPTSTSSRAAPSTPSCRPSPRQSCTTATSTATRTKSS